ncbi:MAG: Holliday junction branch migration protein RuvA [Alphaproteobacteria bacterium]|nr:Holliday junction branch migration protein RuvA [Alphaproteobacteria bacterium]
MIGKLKGLVDSIQKDHLILDVNGVGYVVFASSRTLAMASIGEAMSLLIDTHVREDHIHLFGFSGVEEQRWFRLLTSVQGVGARVGMAILSTCSADQLTMAIAAQDKAPIQQTDGVGPKLATRIVTELKDKVGSMATDKETVVAFTKSQKADAQQSADQDAVSALINLGYGRTEAFTAVMSAKRRDEKADVSSLIRLALQELAA